MRSISIDRTDFVPTHSTALFDRVLIARNNDEGVVAFVMAAASMEAMINDIFAWYEYVFYQIEDINNKRIAEVKKSKNPFSKFACTDDISGCTDDISGYTYHIDPFTSKIKKEEVDIFESLKKERVGFFEKINKVSDILKIYESDCKDFYKASKDLKILFKIRNEIMHAKSKSIVLTNSEEDKVRINKYPKCVRDLFQAKVLNKDIRETQGWFESLDCEEACEWCVKVIKVFVKCFLDIFPKEWEISWHCMKYIESGFLK